MKKTFFLICFISNICLSQNRFHFLNSLNEGTYWFYEEKYDSACYYYSIAEELKFDFYPIEAHLYSRSLWEVGRRKKALKIVSNFGYDTWWNRDTTFYEGITKKQRKAVSKKIPLFTCSEDYPEQNKIDSLTYWATFWRQDGLRLIRNPETQEIDSILEIKLLLQDSINEYNLLIYAKKHGMQGGYKHFPYAFQLILIHSGKEWFFENLPFFLDEIRAGRLMPKDISIVFDRFLTTEVEKNTNFNSYFSKRNIYNEPEAIFFNSIQIGLNPYYYFTSEFLLPKGKKVNQTVFYEYYKANKQNFNSIRFQ